jgi:hypothetical protein
METTYLNPVDKLLTYGDCRQLRTWPNYLELGINEEHIPELIRMLKDDNLNSAQSDSLEVWAPAHAWRVLGQLKAVEAIDALIDRLKGIDEDDDWANEELPTVLAMIGPKAIPKLTEYLKDENNGLFARIAAARTIGEIGKSDGGFQKECIPILSRQLEQYSHNNFTLNAFLILYLTELEALESMDIIRNAFSQDCVDNSVMGDMEDVEIALGVREKRTGERKRFNIFDDF